MEKNSVVANFATTASDGKNYQVEHYNLDVIISLGYRVKSKEGTHFRQWATRRLKDYLIKGYAVNQQRLSQLQQSFKLIREAALSEDFSKSQVREIIDILLYTATDHCKMKLTSPSSHASSPDLHPVAG
ncbi:RhuM family protein [Algoriphagus aquatilis]|uniref:RhuM family protein n=1 Tax=Algoriphagus aquatilis TaxID=490186 RepID=A0ABW0BVQ8_9BACT